MAWPLKAVTTGSVVVLVCAVANEASGTAATITYVAPGATAAGGVGASTDVAGASVAAIGLR